MRHLIAGVLFAIALAGCGGGGPDSGACPFAPSNCATNTGTGGGSSSPTDTGFSRSGTGDTSFALPANVEIVRIQGVFNGNSSNFIVRIGSDLVVNEIVGSSATPQSHDGTYVVVPGSTVTISNSNGVTWSINSASAQSPSNIGSFSKAGSGDQVFELPARSARYRIVATYAGSSSNFIVYVAGSLQINSIIGTGQVPAVFEGIFSFSASGRVEITNSSGVSWSITEL